MKRFIILLLILFLGANFNCVNAAAPVATPEKAPAKQEQPAVAKTDNNAVIKVNSLDLVKFPNRYLDKNITMNCRFDKFSTLGLDYKPAHKSSEDFISFLIKRDDTLNDIPLSELKIFLDKKTAEKFINLKSGDDITVTGKVFSAALGDPWVEVTKLEKVEKK